MISISDTEFHQLSKYIKDYYGIHLPYTKRTLVEGRLYSILSNKNITNFSQFYNYIVSDVTGEAVTLLINRITTNHTFFMREIRHFEYFRDEVLPNLSNANITKKDLRIWSAGCSTGQEPYTLAMIMADYFGKQKVLWDTQVLATDISTQALEKAVSGIYAAEQLLPLPVQWKNNYFKKLNCEKSVIDDTIKKEIIFRRFNLMNPRFPFKKRFHIIFCRNVMIYFDERTKVDLVNKFYKFTEPGGYLFISQSESLNGHETEYKYIMPGVYRKL